MGIYGYIQRVDTTKNVEKEKQRGGCDAHARNDHPHYPREQYPETNMQREQDYHANKKHMDGLASPSVQRERTYVQGKTRSRLTVWLNWLPMAWWTTPRGLCLPSKMSRALSSRHTYIGCFSFTHNHVQYIYIYVYIYIYIYNLYFLYIYICIHIYKQVRLF